MIFIFVSYNQLDIKEKMKLSHLQQFKKIYEAIWNTFNNYGRKPN